ncbi:MerR family transcriptional regulator [Streptomyces paludis]|uniref:MerR family transcriptional regulator n=1 Tax=Streptomyces paludis TaxID=2282738 RepID=A0A345HS88_9ACTN|nr:MerR family transcriptional regulator [Streptomyces paludis]AXG79562.1 MerR family transcriptional regulator [Streptomyces paludis]
MELLTIGDFSARSRLSPKALRLYDRLGLLAPARVDPATGYRWYRPDQVEQARLVALLRQLDMPLARIAEVVALPGDRAADALEAYWTDVEERHAVRRVLATHIRDRLSGRSSHMYEIRTIDVPERTVLAERRQLLSDELPRWIPAAIGRLTEAAAAYGGVTGVPYVAYHAEVGPDSDGPAEACVPVAKSAADDTAAVAANGTAAVPGATVRTEPAQRLAYVRITKAQVAHPQILSAFEAVEKWIDRQGLTITGPCREIYFADWDAASATDEVCDVAFPIG